MAAASEVEVGYWLFKEEPGHYSYADLERDGQAAWEGISNALALKHLRNVRARDRVLYYHTGKEKAVVGEMRVVAVVLAEGSQNPVVTVAPVNRWDRPVTLKEIKQDVRFTDWDLIRLPRLSVLPVSLEQWCWLEAMSHQKS